MQPKLTYRVLTRYLEAAALDPVKREEVAFARSLSGKALSLSVDLTNLVKKGILNQKTDLLCAQVVGDLRALGGAIYDSVAKIKFASKSEPLFKHTNKQDGVEGRVFEYSGGGYTVTLFDLDAEDTLPQMRRLKDYDEACKLAKKWAEGHGGPGSAKL